MYHKNFEKVNLIFFTGGSDAAQKNQTYIIFLFCVI
jgi:hypothetical protein